MLELFLAILVVSLLVIVFIQVVVRYATYQPLAWTEEIARLLFIWVVMAGAVVGAKRGTHFAVTLIFDVLPERTHRIIKVVLHFIEAVFYVVFAWSAVVVTRVANNQNSPSLEYPMSLPYAALAIAAVVMCFFVLRRMIFIARGKV